MKHPEQCEHIQDVRDSIDEIDHQIIRLIGQRADYVRRAAAFKKNKTDVRAKDRVETMLNIRKEWAREESIHPDIVEKIYRDLVNYFIDEELQNWEQKHEYKNISCR